MGRTSVLSVVGQILRHGMQRMLRQTLYRGNYGKSRCLPSSFLSLSFFLIFLLCFYQFSLDEIPRSQFFFLEIPQMAISNFNFKSTPLLQPPVKSQTNKKKPNQPTTKKFSKKPSHITKQKIKSATNQPKKIYIPSLLLIQLIC